MGALVVLLVGGCLDGCFRWVPWWVLSVGAFGGCFRWVLSVAVAVAIAAVDAVDVVDVGPWGCLAGRSFPDAALMEEEK